LIISILKNPENGLVFAFIPNGRIELEALSFEFIYWRLVDTPGNLVLAGNQLPIILFILFYSHQSEVVILGKSMVDILSQIIGFISV
jgi:hypothetical protein